MPLPAAPTLVIVPTVTFVYDTYSVTLPAPEFGNNEELSLSRVQRSSIGGTLDTFRDPQWPVAETLKMRFKNLTNQQIEDFFELQEAALGQVVEYTDYESRVKTGILSNPNNVSAEGRTSCQHTLEVDFLLVEE